MKAPKGSRGIAFPFFSLGAGWGWVVNATPWPLYPHGETRYPLCERLRGPQGRSGRVREISPSPGFDPRTVKPVASVYTDYAIPSHPSLE